MINSIKTYVEGLGIPSWGTIDKIKYEQGVLTIYYCDYYRIVIDKDSPCEDGVVANEGWMWATRDLRFALNILDSREEILEMIGSDVEFFDVNFEEGIDGKVPSYIKRYGEEEEVIEEVILED